VQQFSNTPLHDWSSNGSDAFRYFALCTDDELAKEVQAKKQIPILKTPDYTLDELFAAREDESWRSSVIRI
jgi:hypothetical protein